VAEQVDVLVAGQPGVHEGFLRAVAQPTATADAAFVGAQRTDEDLHEGGLAGAVLADQADDLTWAQGQVDTA
jgi:hypothetical protein